MKTQRLNIKMAMRRMQTINEKEKEKTKKTNF